MFKKFHIFLVAIILSFYGLTAGASDDDLRLNSETKEEIATQLTEQGYEVRKVETEDGYYEAYVMKNGVRYEIYLDKELNIVKIKED